MPTITETIAELIASGRVRQITLTIDVTEDDAQFYAEVRRSVEHARDERGRFETPREWSSDEIAAELAAKEAAAPSFAEDFKAKQERAIRTALGQPIVKPTPEPPPDEGPPFPAPGFDVVEATHPDYEDEDEPLPVEPVPGQETFEEIISVDLALCNAGPDPYGDNTFCQLEKDHRGSHRSAASAWK